MCLLPETSNPLKICSGGECKNKMNCVRYALSNELYFTNEYFEIPPFIEINGEQGCTKFLNIKGHRLIKNLQIKNNGKF